MKVIIKLMRDKGVQLDRRILNDYRLRKFQGMLVILDTTDQGLHRNIKLARLVNIKGEIELVMFEPHIVWANDERIMLTGFERKEDGGVIADYAQSWLCMLGWEKEPSGEKPRSYKSH